MPSGHHPPRRPASKGAKKATPAQIDRIRDRYIEMIALARKLDPHPSQMLDKAHRLLTRHWANSDWAARADILKTVDWVLKVAMSLPASVKDVQPNAAARPIKEHRVRGRPSPS